MNQFERDFEAKRIIQERWVESEWRLGFLRSFTAQPLTDPTDDQLRAWDLTTKSLCSVWQTPPKTNWI